MADKKISALTAATTPLAGTEVLPIVQGGNTVKVSVADLTAGRSISASGLEVTGTVRFVDSTSAGPDLEFGNVGGGTYVNNVANARTYLGAYELVFTNYNNSTEWVRIDNSGNVNAAIGNVKIGTAGKGIDFSANTHAPGMTSEVLDWYEEGTWTPTLVGGTTAGNYTVATTSAKYTRIGRQVTVTARMAITVNSAGTGTAKFGGLPFPKGADQYITGAVLTGNVTYGAGVIATVIQTWTSGSSSDFALAGVKSGTAPYDVDITDFVTGSTVVVSLTYFV